MTLNRFALLFLGMFLLNLFGGIMSEGKILEPEYIERKDKDFYRLLENKLQEIRDNRRKVLEDFISAYLAVKVPDEKMTVDFIMDNFELVEKTSFENGSVIYSYFMRPRT